MAGAPGALHEAGDAFWAADLDDLRDGGEVDTEIKRRGANDAADGSLAQSFFDELSLFLIERAVVHGDFVFPLGLCFEEVLVPDFGLGSGVGKDEGSACLFELLDDGPEQAGADVAGPGEAVDGLGEDRFDFDFLGPHPGNSDAVLGLRPKEDMHGLLGVSERGGESPNTEVGEPLAEAGEAEFGLNAALAADEFVPLIDDHGGEAGKVLAEVIVGEKKRDTFGCGDEAEGEFLAKFGFLVCGGVARAGADFKL